MKRKTFLASSFITFMASAAVLFAVAVFQYGCNSGDQPSTKSSLMSDQPGSMPVENNWMSFGIKFKPNVNSEMRNVSFKAIENLIRDSIQKMRIGKHPNFSPKFLIGNIPFGDTLVYEFRVEYMAKDTTEKPPCRCEFNCGICFQIGSNFDNSKTDTSQIAAPYRNISAILFRPDEH